MNSRIDPTETTPAHLQDPNFTRSATRPVEQAERPMSPTEARQGRRGMPVFMVLVCGLVLAMVAWGAAEWWGQSTEPPAEQTATPPAGSTTPANPNAQPSANP
ncbi:MULTISPECIES: hypothetical protein [unclassified Rhizobium]|uniref:hypothetical protein n=1 Tax=unclassified Rhizobium TaxID=2613769 RepID=UPI003D2B0D79